MRTGFLRRWAEDLPVVAPGVQPSPEQIHEDAWGNLEFRMISRGRNGLASYADIEFDNQAWQELDDDGKRSFRAMIEQQLGVIDGANVRNGVRRFRICL